MPDDQVFHRPTLAVDCVIFGYEENHPLKVLLIQRAHKPDKDMWALPGGFVQSKEELRAAALRVLEEETTVKDVFIEQLFTFGKLNRDPRGRVVSVAYYALVNLNLHPVKPNIDVKNVKWFEVDKLPALAFDHSKILKVAIDHLRAKVQIKPIGFELLPKEFTLSQLQKLYEIILGVEKLNKRNFRTRILKMDVLDEVGIQQNVSHRPAKIYRFNKEKYDQLEAERQQELIKRGVDFKI